MYFITRKIREVSVRFGNYRMVTIAAARSIPEAVGVRPDEPVALHIDNVSESGDDREAAPAE